LIRFACLDSSSMDRVPLFQCWCLGILAITLSGCTNKSGTPPAENLSSSTSSIPTDSTTITTATTTTVTTTSPIGASPMELYIDSSTDVWKPWLTRSTCKETEFRGMVLFFHGFTASGQQVEQIAPILNEQCFDVAAPNLPGHGVQAISNCDASGVTCTVHWRDGKGFDLRKLPTQGQRYLDFVSDVNEVFRKEVKYRARVTGKAMRDLVVAVMGLSFGSSLAAYASSLTYGMYTHQLLLSSFFGIGDAAFDEQAHNSFFMRFLDSRLDHLVLENLVIASDTLSDDKHMRSISNKINVTMLKTITWDANCRNLWEYPSGAFCIFQYKHILAVHSAAQHALTRALSKGARSFPLTQLISTERDGITPNGYTYNLASKIYRQSCSQRDRCKIAMCLYRFQNQKAPRDYSDENCLPHACLTPPPLPQGWYKKAVFSQIVNFMTGNTTLTSSFTWDGTRDHCVGLPLQRFAHFHYPWLATVVLPSAAPNRERSIRPGILWKGVVLNSDSWAWLFCKVPGFGYLAQRYMDCSVFEFSKGAMQSSNLKSFSKNADLHYQ